MEKGFGYTDVAREAHIACLFKDVSVVVGSFVVSQIWIEKFGASVQFEGEDQANSFERAFRGGEVAKQLYETLRAITPI